MSFKDELVIRLKNAPTIMLVGLQLPQYSKLYQLFFLKESNVLEFRYILLGVVLQAPLFLTWRRLPVSLELKTAMLVLLSVIIGSLFFASGRAALGDSIGIGLLPLILYYYVQYQRDLTWRIRMDSD